jgi:hypothetical protein
MGVALAALIVSACVTGCATSRSEITLKAPISAAATATSGQVVVIRSVADERVFEQAPKDPSIPSLGHEGSENASAETKASAIGRKRNTWGKALGDVLLDNGATVAGVVRENLATALTQAGYQVKDESAAGSAPLIIDVHIKQFWAWFRPGFWSITLNTDIATDLLFSGMPQPTSVTIHAEESRQIATDSAWMEIVEKALGDYRTQVAAKAAGFPKPTSKATQ